LQIPYFYNKNIHYCTTKNSFSGYYSKYF